MSHTNKEGLQESSMRNFERRSKQTSIHRCFLGLLGLAVVAPLGACALPEAGPSTRSVNRLSDGLTERHAGAPVQLVDISGAVTRRLLSVRKAPSFQSEFGDAPAYGSVIGRGDGLDIAVWEAPPAVLFGSSSISGMLGDATSINRATSLPEQIVNQDGMIRVPFVGLVRAVGRTPEEVGQEIRQRLSGKAHDPQVVVRIVRNSAADVTVVGDVGGSVRMPLTPKGERVLDALASAGGVRQAVGKILVQVTRGSKVVSMPLSSVIRDPRENVRLSASDVVTALFQPYSFTVLGAAGRNEEIPFEGTGLTLSQALGRMSGLNDQRANPRGVFIFRFEDSSVFAVDGVPMPALTPEGKVPVIYRVDMKDPTTLLLAQSFPISDKDVIYVSNAPMTDFQKVLQTVSQIVYPIISIESAIYRF